MKRPSVSASGDPSPLKNIGPRSWQWLNAIGIFTREDLAEIGVMATFRSLLENGRPVTVNLVYAMQAALMDVHWTNLPQPMKRQLRAEALAERDVFRRRETSTLKGAS